ncbi:hypothetical protein Y1Q_0009925 [Alligator mississippiensis]|uniref:Uncharacterized protein n=1 Tax=Alligator mississippiensis TaxID=8496 RepID=A0A151MXI7_ALLMI|nr:hypothetical protein Y1Q_0009925 [Alligator mississippiensis]
MLDTEGEDISEGAEALLDNTFLMRPVTLVLEKRNCFCDKQSLSRADRVLRELLIRKIANTSNFSHGEKKYLPPGGQSASQQSQKQLLQKENQNTHVPLSLPCSESESNTSKGGDVPENRLPETLKSQESD